MGGVSGKSDVKVSIPLEGQTEEERHSHALKQKQVLIETLFQAIDTDHSGYLDRFEVLDWLQREPYLQQECLRQQVLELWGKLDHEEDSQCSLNEFSSAMKVFDRNDIILLVVNLLRSTPIISASASASGEQHHDQTTPELPTDQDQNNNSCHHHAHHYLIDIFFHAIDADRNGVVDAKELNNWITGDVYFQNEVTIRSAIALLISSVASGGPHHQVSLSLPEFSKAFHGLPSRELRKLLVHLLSRSTTTVVNEAKTARKQLESVAIDIDPAKVHPADQVKESLRSVPPVSKWRKVSVLVHSSAIQRLQSKEQKAGLQFVVLGQSMIQHDLRMFQHSNTKLNALKPIFANSQVVFSELETAIIPASNQAKATRDTVFFHAADATVLDCLKELGINLISAANNHSGDMGELGILTLMQELGSRFAFAGIGMDADDAAKPCYLDSPLGKVGQVAFASKIPLNSDAWNDPKRAGVNSLSMVSVEERKLDAQQAARQLNAIAEARKNADYVVAYHHNHYWEKSAVNLESKMGSWKRDWAHQCIDAGATMYVGHGDPRLQGIEIYNGCPIFYCLGNFFFQTKTEIGFYGPEVWQSVIVHIEHQPHPEHPALGTDNLFTRPRNEYAPSPAPQTGEEIIDSKSRLMPYSVRLIPIVLNEKGAEGLHLETRGIPSLASKEEGRLILLKLQKLSDDFGTIIEIDDSQHERCVGWLLANREQNHNISSQTATAHVLQERHLAGKGNCTTLTPPTCPLVQPIPRHVPVHVDGVAPDPLKQQQEFIAFHLNGPEGTL